MEGKKKILNDELGRLSVEGFKAAEKNGIYVLLDNIRSRNNVGSIFRTCDAFRVKEIILGGITPIPPHRDIYKTALGATESVDWKHCADLKASILSMKEEGIVVLAVEQVENAHILGEFEKDNSKEYAFVFGSEVGGVDQEIVNICDGSIEIPQYGTKHSLNVAMSVGVVLWEMVREAS